MDRLEVRSESQLPGLNQVFKLIQYVWLNCKALDDSDISSKSSGSKKGKWDLSKFMNNQKSPDAYWALELEND